MTSLLNVVTFVLQALERLMITSEIEILELELCIMRHGILERIFAHAPEFDPSCKNLTQTHHNLRDLPKILLGVPKS